MLGRLPYFAAVAIAFVAGPVLAQEALAPNTPFDEHRYERAKVSGGLVVGVMFSPDNLQRNQPRLQAALPTIGERVDTVCVRVTSRDGTYEAANTYSLPDAVGRQELTFSYPTRYPEVLREIPTVARMNLGDCDQDGPVIPVLWGDADARVSGDVTIYINTAGADTLLAYETASGEVVTHCTQIEETGGIKYTATCPVNIAGIPGNTLTTLYFDVTRNRTSETYEVEVMFAGD